MPKTSMGTRRRGAELERAILHAAAEELRESGYAGMTMDRVAARARTNKNALYRRWPHRAALGVAAYHHLSDTVMPDPDTGTLRGDALEMLRRANETWSSPYGAVLRALLAAAAEDPELLGLMRERSGADTMDRAWVAMLERAAARGEAVPAAVHPRVATTPMMLLRGEYAVRGIPSVPDDVLVEIVDEVFLPLVRGRASWPPPPRATRASRGSPPVEHAGTETQLPAAAAAGRAEAEGLRRHRAEAAGRTLARRAGRPRVEDQRDQPAHQSDDHDHQQRGVPGAAFGGEQHNGHDDHPPTNNPASGPPGPPFAAVPAPPTA